MLVPHAGAYGKRHRCSVGAYYLTGCGAECGAGYRLFRREEETAGRGWGMACVSPVAPPGSAAGEWGGLAACGGAWPRYLLPQAPLRGACRFVGICAGFALGR